MKLILDLAILILLGVQVRTLLGMRRAQRNLYESQHRLNELTNQRLGRLEALNFGVDIEERES
jgi:hypothetical protein